jgi:hypothetical protein
MDVPTTPPLFVGIDVSKDHLDVSTSGSQSWRIPNEPAAIEALAEQLHAQSPHLVVLEATGRYEAACAAALAATGVPTAVVNPRQVRDFARATGQLAKTDAIDAAVLALFAERVRPEPRPLLDAETEILQALLLRRRQLLHMLVAEKNRALRASSAVKASLAKHIRWLERELAAVEDDLDEAIRASPVWRAKEDLLAGRAGSGARPGDHPPGRAAGVGPAEPARDRRARRGGPAQPRQRDAQRAPLGVGRAIECKDGALHGGVVGGAVEPGNPGVPRATAQSG